jgi:hypothetical protein
MVDKRQKSAVANTLYPAKKIKNAKNDESARFLDGLLQEEPAVFWIQDIYPGSWIRNFPSRISVKKTPDPGSGSATKNLSNFADPDPGSCAVLTLDPGPDLGSRISDPNPYF